MASAAKVTGQGSRRVRPAQSLDLPVERRVSRALRAGNARPAEADQIAGPLQRHPPLRKPRQQRSWRFVFTGCLKVHQKADIAARQDRQPLDDCRVDVAGRADNSGCPQVRRHRVFQREPLGLNTGQVGPQPQFGG